VVVAPLEPLNRRCQGDTDCFGGVALWQWEQHHIPVGTFAIPTADVCRYVRVGVEFGRVWLVVWLFADLVGCFEDGGDDFG